MRRGGGFSLLEIIIASVLFSMVLTGLAAVWAMHSKAQISSLSRSVAADLAELEMERTLALGYFNAVSVSGRFEQVWQVRGTSVTRAFDTQTEVSHFVDPDQTYNGRSYPGLKQVTVTVSFDGTGSGSGAESFTLRSYLVDDT